ncbi:MAG: SGNH/GDSL hydrolase family protein [Deltaproteobacteria bacterium]|nr:SGNH/GDSL hydrolase family protein [Deltaproteobacteria bacterium]
MANATADAPRRPGELLLDMHGAPRLSGRFDLEDPAGPRFAWSGTSIAARFQGTAITIRLRGSSDFFNVTLDGAALPVLAASPAVERYPLATGLADGEHEVVVVKRTEPLVSEAQLLGFELDPRGRLLPPPPAPARRIEFVGDSVTAGFGVLGRDETCPFSPDTEDFSLSFAALTAAALGAEPVAVAWSGRGACRNYADEPGEPMPVLYERTLPARAESRWDFGRWTPDVVVINLGTNDFSLGVSPGDHFPAAYSALVRRIHAAYDRARIVCCLGPMLTDPALAEARAGITRGVEDARAAGVERVDLLEFPPQSAANGFGCDGHPSAVTHRLLAAQLTGSLRQAMGW